MAVNDKKAVVLLSGGLDSTTVLAIAKQQGFSLHALSFDYGQKNRFELKAAQEIAAHYSVAAHKIVPFDLRAFGHSSLTSDLPVERGRAREEIGRQIPSTYVPARNTICLSFALAWAEVLRAADIFIGVNAIDTSGYPDCRPEYIEAFSKMANLATKLGTELETRIVIHSPLAELTKKDIIELGTSLGVDYSMTSTCYDPLPGGIACGTCDACTLRIIAFKEAGAEDPLRYALTVEYQVR